MAEVHTEIEERGDAILLPAAVGLLFLVLLVLGAVV